MKRRDDMSKKKVGKSKASKKIAGLRAKGLSDKTARRVKGGKGPEEKITFVYGQLGLKY